MRFPALLTVAIAAVLGLSGCARSSEPAAVSAPSTTQPPQSLVEQALTVQEQACVADVIRTTLGTDGDVLDIGQLSPSDSATLGPGLDRCIPASSVVPVVLATAADQLSFTPFPDAVVACAVAATEGRVGTLILESPAGTDGDSLVPFALLAAADGCVTPELLRSTMSETLAGSGMQAFTADCFAAELAPHLTFSRMVAVATQTSVPDDLASVAQAAMTRCSAQSPPMGG